MEEVYFPFLSYIIYNFSKWTKLK